MGYLLVAISPIFLLSAFMLFYRRKMEVKCHALKTHFDGKITLLGELRFEFKSMDLRLRRVSVGNRSNGFGGSYPVLMANVPDAPVFVMGNRGARAVLYLRSFPKNSRVEGERFVVSNDERLIKKGFEFLNRHGRVFSKEFSYLKVRREWHFAFPFMRREKVMYFVGIPEEIYESPSLFEGYLEAASDFRVLFANG